MKNKLNKSLQLLIVLAIAGGIIGFSNKNKETDNRDFEQYFKLQYQHNDGMTNVAKMIRDKKTTSAANFKEVSVFTRSTGDNVDTRALNNFVSDAVTLTLDRQKLADIRNSGESNINFRIPSVNGQDVVLELTKAEVVTDDFRLTAAGNNGLTAFSYKKGAYYRGIVKGDEKSFAAISIFDGHLMGVLSDARGNYVLGTIKDDNKQPTSNYIFYNDGNVISPDKFECGVENYESRLLQSAPEGTHIENTPDAMPGALKVYFQADYQIYIDAGEDLQLVGDYITGLFNVTALIYQNESIPFMINNIQVWTTLDPYYWYDDSYDILKTFAGTIKNNWSGNIAHLLSTRDEGLGGIANIRSLCKSFNPADSSGSYCFSNIHTSYQPFPTYSWSVMVVTHEMGHNVGSRHTHACVWPKPNGSIGPIDTCVVTGENLAAPYGIGCLPPTVNPNGYVAWGTIMSYCHFQQNNGGGINLTLGFGQLPGDTIRLRYTQANCVTGIQQVSSQVPSKYHLEQNYPNPFNPVTNIKFNIPQAGNVKLTVFDITGKVVATLVDGQLTAGTYNYDFDAATLPSGIYFYRLNTDNFMEVKKMMLVK